MRADNLKLFGGLAASFARAGFPAADILPLIPPVGATLSEKSNLTARDLGKIPGYYKGDGVWRGLHGSWPSAGLDARTLKAAREWPTENIGLRSADFPCVDIDTKSTAAREMVEGVLRRVMPDSVNAPVRFRADAVERALYPFRRSGDAPLRTQRLKWTDADGVEHGLDLLGLGFQYVVSGIHPKGARYEWRDGKDLQAVGARNLPALTNEDADAFIEALTAEITERGGSIVTASKNNGQSGPEYDYSKHDPLIPVAMALDALNAIPNTPEALPLRNDILAMVAAFKAATGREAESLRPQVEDWATLHGWADDTYFAGVWDELRVSRTPHDFLIYKAREFDWRGDAELDFAQVDEAQADETQRRYSGGPLKFEGLEGAAPNVATVAETLTEQAEGLLSYDTMKNVVTVNHPIRPDLEPAASFKPRPITDTDVLQILVLLQKGGLRRVGKEAVIDGIQHAAKEKQFHPVKDYLRGAEWDGVDRLSTFLHRYAGAEDNEYNREVGRMMMIAAVARVMDPGCKADHMVVLEGSQGAGKSTFVRILGGEWTSDSMITDVRNKDAALHLVGKWFVEIPELNAFSKSETNDLKAFLSKDSDKIRPPFGRVEVDHKRSSIFIGTTNDDHYLRDETGARRFWPVKTGSIDTHALKTDRDQLFAEALARYERKENWWPDRETEERLFKPEQEARREADEWEAPIAAFLEDRSGESLTMAAVALGALGMQAATLHGFASKRIGSIMRRLGWQGHRTKAGTIWREAGAADPIHGADPSGGGWNVLPFRGFEKDAA